MLNKLVASMLTKIESWRYPAAAGLCHYRKKHASGNIMRVIKR
jgi:hypothetical protein